MRARRQDAVNDDEAVEMYSNGHTDMLRATFAEASVDHTMTCSNYIRSALGCGGSANQLGLLDERVVSADVARLSKYMVDKASGVKEPLTTSYRNHLKHLCKMVDGRAADTSELPAEDNDNRYPETRCWKFCVCVCSPEGVRLYKLRNAVLRYLKTSFPKTATDLRRLLGKRCMFLKFAVDASGEEFDKEAASW